MKNVTLWFHIDFLHDSCLKNNMERIILFDKGNNLPSDSRINLFYKSLEAMLVDKLPKLNKLF